MPFCIKYCHSYSFILECTLYKKFATPSTIDGARESKKG